MFYKLITASALTYTSSIGHVFFRDGILYYILYVSVNIVIALTLMYLS